MRVGIIGYGEIGSAIAAIYRKRGLQAPAIYDPALGYTDHIDMCDVIHVAVPGSVVPAVVTPRRRTPLYIVHSTVPPGTCRRIYECNLNMRIVHAPVRGIHPELARGIETFTMPIGGPANDSQGRPSLDHITASNVLQRLGITVELWEAWEETELAKVLCTTQLGLDILFMRHVAELAAKYGASFDRVYTQWRLDYNDGFERLDRWELHRPTLLPMAGKIGGHCVVPNARMISDESEWAAIVAERGDHPWVAPPSVATPAPNPRP